MKPSQSRADDLGAEGALGQPLAERRQASGAGGSRLRALSCRSWRSRSATVSARSRATLGAEVLPVKVARPERGGAAVHLRERHLRRGGEGGDALGQPESVPRASLLHGQERDGRHHDKPQDRVLPVADQHDQTRRTLRSDQAGIATFFRRSSSSSTLPVPSATHESGSSATVMGRFVSCRSRRSSPRSSAPPPVRTMPLSTMSAASSGGVRSRHGPHRVHDGHDGLAQRLADLLVGDHDGLRDAVDQVAALDLHRPALAAHRVGRAELDLDLFRPPLADEQVVVLA